MMDVKDRKITQLEKEKEEIQQKARAILAAIETKMGSSHLVRRQYVESEEFYREVVELLRDIADWGAARRKAAEEVAKTMAKAIGEQNNSVGEEKRPRCYCESVYNYWRSGGCNQRG